MVYLRIPEIGYSKEILESIQKKVIGANLEEDQSFLDNLLTQLDTMANTKSVIEVGEHIVRLLDGRHYYVTYVNNNVRASGGVFSAKATDGGRDHWGGSLLDLREGLTFIKLSPKEAQAVVRSSGNAFRYITEPIDPTKSIVGAKE